MLEYDRIYVSEGIDINKTYASKECDICHYCQFLDKTLIMNSIFATLSLNFNDVAIVSVKGNDYRLHFWYMSKDDAIIIMNDSSLNEKTGSL